MFDAVTTLWMELLLWAVGFAAGFTLLARLWPCNPAQPFWRKGLITDVLYYFFMPVLNRFMQIIFIGAGVFFLFSSETPDTIIGYMQNGYGAAGSLPIWAQAAIVFIATDIALYWLHRWFHGSTMWKFHAIHHSSEHVDWLSTYRFHPVNSWLSFTLVDATMMLIGFSPAAVATTAGFNMIYSAMVHANVNWTFGPLKYVFASPVFHRWHHTAQEEGMDKNFAPTFPILDVMFGTFYMPDKVPEKYGVAGSDIPHDLLGQLLWPFKKHS